MRKPKQPKEEENAFQQFTKIIEHLCYSNASLNNNFGCDYRMLNGGTGVNAKIATPKKSSSK